ncbi:MAG: PEP-utilizing enzyme, partial [Ilumatobacteraceae bacterium]
AHVLSSATLHFRLHTSDLGPIGLLLTAAEDWRLDQNEVMEALAGASPATSAPALALAELRLALLEAGVTPTSLAEVRAAGDRPAELLDAYLDDYGSRLTTGYDISDATLGELPDVVLGSILDERPAEADASARGDAALAGLRTQVPPGDRERFDELVADARWTYGLRDENGPITYEWPGGILRRAVVEAAARLVAGGRIADVDHVFDASAAELAGMLRGSEAPSAAELTDRFEERMSWAELDAPLVLGPPAPDPPLDALPEAMGTMMRVSFAVLELLEADAGSDGLTGTGIGDQAYRGTARVVADADEALDRAEPGDVIVTRLTVPTFNSVLAMAGAVVTEHGGLLCHTAVIARELGIPAVVGVADALTAIPDGAEVEVDPVAGAVSVVS